MLVHPEILSSPRTLDFPGFVIRHVPGSDVAELILKEGIHFDENQAKATRNALESLAQGRKLYLLVGSEGFVRISRRARKLGASASFSSHLAAVACYTSNHSLALVGELYNKINQPKVPTRVFATREAAEEWLTERRNGTTLR